MTKKFPFGLDQDRVKEQFTAIGEGLESGDVIPQGVSYTEEHRCDEFVIRTVSLTFAMKVEKENEDGSMAE